MKHENRLLLAFIPPAAAFGRLCVETPTELVSSKGLLQPPSGGCVLKLTYPDMTALWFEQPPSGGCVLKHLINFLYYHDCQQPPSGGCVLKPCGGYHGLYIEMAAAFGRLCVETF